LNFYLRRYLNAFKVHKTWLLWALAPCILFVVGSAVRPSTYRITGTVSLPRDAPLAVPSHPVAVLSPARFSANPGQLLLDRMVLLALERHLTESGLIGAETNADFAPRSYVSAHVRVEAAQDGTVRVTSSGGSRAIGAAVVRFYTNELAHLAWEGLRRAARSDGGTPALPPPQPPRAGAGELEILAQRTLWEPSRITILLDVCGVALLVILLLIAAVEFFSSSLKSERQVARYLGLPILGSVPDLGRMASLLQWHKD